MNELKEQAAHVEETSEPSEATIDSIHMQQMSYWWLLLQLIYSSDCILIHIEFSMYSQGVRPLRFVFILDHIHFCQFVHFLFLHPPKKSMNIIFALHANIAGYRLLWQFLIHTHFPTVKAWQFFNLSVYWRHDQPLMMLKASYYPSFQLPNLNMWQRDTHLTFA